MKTIIVENGIKKVCPTFKGVAIYATFVNTDFLPELWEEIADSTAKIQERHTPETLKLLPPIEATRKVYKALGKDPSRYRPSGEALVRRTLQGKKLYKVNTAVDLTNLASIEFGYSIGAFDCDKIEGDTIRLGVGKKDEPYEGIGRGVLNIDGLPVYRDNIGAFATPTSDNERTKMDITTTHLLAFVNGYDGNESLAMTCANRIVELLRKYAQCEEYDIEPFDD